MLSRSHTACDALAEDVVLVTSVPRRNTSSTVRAGLGLGGPGYGMHPRWWGLAVCTIRLVETVKGFGLKLLRGRHC